MGRATVPDDVPLPVTWMRAVRLLRTTLAGAGSASRHWRIPSAVRAPIFLIGAPRSGTTFLGRCVGQLPGVASYNEPPLTKALTSALYEGAWSPRRAAPVYRLTYGLLLAADGGRGRFAEKTPQNCFIVPFLADRFPDAQFLHIIRDGRDAALSWSRKPWLAERSRGSGKREDGGYSWGPYPRFWVEPDRRAEFALTTDLHRCIWGWRRHTEAAQQAGAQLPAERYREIRYEDLVQDCHATAAVVADFLGLSEADLTDFHAAVAAADSASVGAWRRELTDPDRAVVDREAGALLRALGYGATA